MAEVSFEGLVIVAAAAFVAPLALGLAPALRLPAVVLEIVIGIVIGPALLGWVEVGAAIQLMSLLGLAFLLLLAGLEIEFERLRGRLLRVTALGFAVSLVLAILVGVGLDAISLAEEPVLIAIALAATSLGVVIPVLEDSGEASSSLGQLVIAGAAIADVATIVLLSLFFSEETSGLGARVLLLGGFALLAVTVALTIAGLEHSRRVMQTLVRLQDTTAQIRVRGAFLLLAAFVVAAEKLGVEAILGAFLAGAILKLVDRDEAMTHPEFRRKLAAAGFGIFIPFFFVASGLRFDLDALFADASALALVPVFLAALLVVRAAPALLYRPLVGTARSAAAGLLQATSLGFLVVVAMLGMELGLLTAGTGAALIAAGLLSVLLFPLTALAILRRADGGAVVTGSETAETMST